MFIMLYQPFIGNDWLVYLPLWKIWKSVGITIPNIWKCSKPLTRWPFFYLSTIFSPISQRRKHHCLSPRKFCPRRAACMRTAITATTCLRYIFLGDEIRCNVRITWYNNVINHPWLGMVNIPILYDDDWGMVYDIVIPALTMLNGMNTWDFMGFNLWCHQTWQWKIPYEWGSVFKKESHGTKWSIFQHGMFDYRRVVGIRTIWIYLTYHWH